MEKLETKLQLYYVSNRYLRYLKSYEEHVWENSDKENQRPYVGIILKINGYMYFAPLTSAKPKHLKWKDSLTSIRIEFKSELLAILCLNNMIPVPDGEVSLVDIESCLDKNYQNLLNKEAIGIRHKNDKIIRTAYNLYNELSRVDNTKSLIIRIRSVCFNFKELERLCNAFKAY